MTFVKVLQPENFAHIDNLRSTVILNFKDFSTKTNKQTNKQKKFKLNLKN